jgi:hypothetical protein
VALGGAPWNKFLSKNKLLNFFLRKIMSLNSNQPTNSIILLDFEALSLSKSYGQPKGWSTPFDLTMTSLINVRWYRKKPNKFQEMLLLK